MILCPSRPMRRVRSAGLTASYRRSYRVRAALALTSDRIARGFLLCQSQWYCASCFFQRAHTSISLPMIETDDSNPLVSPSCDTEGRIPRLLKLLLAAGLAALSIAYLGKGFFFGALLDASDVKRRWLEERYVLLAQNLDPRIAVRLIRRDVIYPPWAYFSGVLLFWPPWPQVRIWFALINLACLI